MARSRATKPDYAEKGRRISRADRYAPGTATIKDDAELNINGESQADRERNRRYTILASSVDQNIREAIMARENSGIEEIWMEDEDQYNGIDDLSAPYSRVKTRDQVPRQAARDSRSKVFVPITKPKTDIGVSRVSEMLLPNDDKPWDIQHTKIPDIEEQVNAGPNETVQLGDGTQAPAAAVAAMILDKAKEFASLEADYIEDKFQEGEVYSHMRQVLRDAGRIGTGVLKGPTPVKRITKKWSVSRAPMQAPTLAATDGKTIPPVEIGNVTTPQGLAGATTKLQRIEKIEPTSICIRVQDCYPDPACGDSIHDGAHFTERAFLTGKKVRELAFLPGYDAKCIVDALREGPTAYIRTRDSTFRQQVGDTNYDSKLFEVMYHYMDCSPDDLRLLMERGNKYPKAEGENDSDNADELDEGEDNPLDDVLSKEDQLYLRSVPAIVTMLNGKPIKAELNPMEVGGFPYDFFPWEPVKGQPYGRGIPRKMAVAQRMLNASVRAMLENAGLSAGAQIITAKGVITPWNGVYEVVGRKGWDFTPNDSGIDDVRKAFMVETIPSVTEEMTKIIQLALDFSDQLTNLPMLMQGDQQAGTSPETLGGLKLLFNNAMSPLRTIAKLFDDKLIVPHLKRYHDWAMEKGPDNIKGGDSQIVAKGSTALIQREEGREFLTQIFPVKDDPKLRIDPIKLIREMARSNGFDMSTVQYTDEEWADQEAKAAQNPPPPDPTVQSAQIRGKALVDAATISAKDADAERQAKERMAEADRQFEASMKEIDKQIAEMTLSGKSGESLMQIKAQLAQAAMANRMKADEMSLKLDPANKSHLGI